MKKFLFLFAALLAFFTSASAREDVTSTYLTNAGLSSLEGWTIDSSQPGTGSWSGYTAHNTSGAVPVIEFYHAWSAQGGASIGASRVFDFKQTATLPQGYYRLKVNGFYREGNNNPTTNQQKAYIFAGEKTQYLAGFAGFYNQGGSSDIAKAASCFGAGYYENSFDFDIDADDTEVSIGFHGYIDTYCSWCIIGPVTLYKYDISDFMEDFNEKVTAARALYDTPMNADVLTALKSAAEVETSGWTTKEQITAAEGVLTAALADATASVAAYANAKAYLDEAAAILENTNVYTADAYATYFSTPQSKYSNATLTNEEANVLVKMSTGWHSSNTISEILLSAFDVHGGDFDHGYYINTWSTEGSTDGSGFTVPFIEYWTGDGDKLADKTIHAQMTGLERGIYNVTAQVRLRLTSGQTAPVSGLSLKVNEGEASAVSGELNYGDFYVANVAADGTVFNDGVLDINFIVANANSSWVSIKDVKFTRTGDIDPTEYRAAVAAKLETAQGLVNEVMNADVETDLNDKIGATDGYEESTDIDALEQMANNLDAAIAAAQTSIANYQEAAAIINAASTLDEAGQAVYNSNNKVLEVKAGYDNKTLVAVTEEQKGVCKDALKVAVKAQTTDGADWTLLIDNADFEGRYTSVYKPSEDRDIYEPEGWTAFWENGNANDMTALNSTCTSWNQFENMAQPVDGGNNVYWARYNWGKQSSITLKQTVNLPAGLYELGAEGYLSNATNGKATLSAKFGDEVALVDFTASEWTKKTVQFYISEAQDVEFIYNFTENVPSTPTEIKAGVDNFTLTSHAIADADDYAALNAAIETAEAKKLGFKAGEYAPYTNVGVLSPLAAAKAIDQTAVNAKSAVVIATSLLNGAQSAWVENTEDMSIVYNGTFVASVNDGAPAGWETDNAAGLGSALHARAFVLNPGDNNYDKLVSFEQGDATRSAFYVRFDGTNSTRTTDYTYGETAGYTMPLEAGVYRVKLMAGGWGKTQPLNVKFEDADGIIKGEQVVEMTNIADGSGVAASFNFLSEVEAGDYKLVVSNGNIEADNAAAISNVEITLEMTATELAALREEIIVLRTKVDGYTELPEPLATEAAAAVAEAYGYINEHVCDPALLNACKARLQAVAGNAEFVVMIAEAEALAADDEAVAVGKLSDAIEVAKAVVTPTDEDKAALQAAIDQFNLDNADQESDQTAKVATNGWKKFDGSAAGVCATQFAPAIDTYDGRKNVNLAESYEEGTAEGTAVTRLGTIIYQDITGLKNGSYKVGFYGNAFFTEGRAGMTSPMEDGATDVAYVFANDQQSFITAHIATSTTENNFKEFDVEVTDGTIRLGMGKAQAGTNWHTMQIYRLTWFTTAKALYALDKADMEAAILLAGALYEDPYKTNGKEALQQAIAEANAARISNHLNIAEFEAEIAKLNDAIKAYKEANYVAFDGTYYVKNAAGKYMAAGHDWGTRGIVNETGLDLTLTPDNANKVSFDSRVANSASNHFLSDGLYMDGPAFAWAIEQIGAEEYSISNGTKYVGVDENDNLVLVDEPAAWQFVSADDVFAARVAALDAATADNGVSATFYMQNPNFNRNDQRVEGWNVSEDCTNKNLNGGNNLNNCAESFHSTFTIKQVISGAPAGVYKLEAQGFYRQDDALEEDAPVFFIGDATAEVPVKTGDEGSMAAASESFTNGLYNIEPLEFVYDGEGDLEVGVKATGVHQWVIFDNFRLTYFGAAPAPEPTDYTDHIVNADLTSTDPKGFDDAGTKFIDGSGIVKAANNAVYIFNQTINLPAGQYKLTAQAAYRYSGSEADEYAAIEAGTETKFASLYANVGGVKTSALVQNRWDGASDVDYAAGDGSVVVNEKYVPNSSNAVKAWFAAGQYVNEVVFNLFDAGDVIIGIEKDAQPEAGDYTVIGPWTLTRIGDADVSTYYETIANLLTEAQGLLNSVMNATVESNLNDAVTATAGYTEVTDVVALQAMIDGLTSANATATVSVANYEEAAAILNAASVLDEDGQAVYNANNKVLEVKAAYDNKTLVAVTDEQKADCQAALLVAVKAQTTAGSDWSLLIANPSFETGDTSGWTVGSSSDTGARSTSNATYAMEGAEGNWLFNTWWQGIPLTQNIGELPAGEYKLSAMTASDGAVVYLIANGEHSEGLKCTNAAVASLNEYSFKLYAPAEVTIGVVGGNENGTYNPEGYWWYKADVFKLTLVRAGLPELIKVVGQMNATVSQAQDDAFAAYEADPSEANYLAAAAAIDAAQVSVDAYAEGKKSLDKVDDILANTNVYTTEAYATFGEAHLAAQNGYNNGTWTNEEAQAYGPTVFGTGWHTNNTVDDLLLSAFDVHGGDYDHGYYINTWSVEGDNDGSGYTAPFIEYWTGDGEVLADNTIHAQMTGLEPGVYTVTALVRQHLSNQFAEDTEVTGLGLGVCSWEVIPSTGAINIAGTRFFMETIEASGEVFTDGVLDINFIVKSANCSWVSIKNVKFEKTGAPTGIKSLDVEEEGTLKDGKYLIKDKIVIVKNGKMYNAAGGLQK